MGAQPLEGSTAYQIQCYVTIHQEEAVPEKAADSKKAAKPVKVAKPVKAAEKKTEVRAAAERYTIAGK